MGEHPLGILQQEPMIALGRDDHLLVPIQAEVEERRVEVQRVGDHDVEEALAGVQKKGLVKKLISSGRVERWKHELYDAWKLGKVELAVLTELLLRGPQTEGELRGRASRMEPIDDLDALRAVLKPLVDRNLVVYVTPEGRRGTVLTHGFHAADELDGLRRRHGAEAGVESQQAHRQPAPATSHAERDQEFAALHAQLAETRAETAGLRGELKEVQSKLAEVAEQVRALKEALGA